MTKAAELKVSMFYKNYLAKRTQVSGMCRMLVTFELMLIWFLASEFWTDAD